MNNPTHNKMLWLTAAAVAAAAAPVSAEVYLTESQALGAVLGDKAVMRREQKTLDPALRKRLEDTSGLRFPETSVTFFIAAQDGKPGKYAVVMNEIGKSEPITFMVGMSPEGKVTEVVIMEFRENRGWEVKEKRFLNQFRGKTAKSSIRIDEDIINYTGATLSSKAVARGVKRALLLMDAFYPGETRYKLNAAQDFALPSDPRPIATTPAGTKELGLFRQARYAMGTQCEIRAWCFSPHDARAAFELGFGELERIEQMFSAYREDSELSLVNRTASDRGVRASREFFEVAQFALKASEQTSGAVNFAVGPLADLWKQCANGQCWPTSGEIARARMLSDVRNIELNKNELSLKFRVPGMKIDFGGIAKGYAAEKVGKRLEESGTISALVNLGGSSIYAARLNANYGTRVAEEAVAGHFDAWPVGILQPSESRGVAETMSLSPGEVVSTSGTTERGFVIRGEWLSHVLDPRTGFPIRGIRSATVIGRDGVQAEAASKALLLARKPDEFAARAADRLSYWIRLEATDNDEPV